MNFDDTDKSTASAVEAAMKDASVNGVAGFTDPVMTEDQYTPSDGSVAPTLPRDFNRDQAIAIVGTLRTVPMRVPVCSISNLPPPVQGGIIYVSNGSDGGPCLAFSDGQSWLRCDSPGLQVGVSIS